MMPLTDNFAFMVTFRFGGKRLIVYFMAREALFRVPLGEFRASSLGRSQ
jgi:hypothetical protein